MHTNANIFTLYRGSFTTVHNNLTHLNAHTCTSTCRQTSKVKCVFSTHTHTQQNQAKPHAHHYTLHTYATYWTAAHNTDMHELAARSRHTDPGMMNYIRQCSIGVCAFVTNKWWTNNNKFIEFCAIVSISAKIRCVCLADAKVYDAKNYKIVLLLAIEWCISTSRRIYSVIYTSFSFITKEIHVDIMQKRQGQCFLLISCSVC